MSVPARLAGLGLEFHKAPLEAAAENRVAVTEALGKYCPPAPLIVTLPVTPVWPLRSNMPEALYEHGRQRRGRVLRNRVLVALTMLVMYEPSGMPAVLETCMPICRFRLLVVSVPPSVMVLVPIVAVGSVRLVVVAHGDDGAAGRGQCAGAIEHARCRLARPGRR